MLIRLLFILLCISTLPVKVQAQTFGEWEAFRNKKLLTSAKVLAPQFDPTYYIIKLQPNTKVASICEQGITLIRKLDSQHWIVKGEDSQQVFYVSGIEAASPANDLWKMPVGFAVEQAASTDLVVKVTAIDQFIQQAQNQQLGISIKRQYKATNTLVLEGISTAALKKMMALDELLFINTLPKNRPQAESRVLGMDLSVNQITTLKHHEPSLDGNGLLVGVNEQRFDVEDIDLAGRAEASGFESENSTEHATNMATTIAGAGNSSMNGLGIAVAAKLSSTDNITRFPDEANYYTSSNIYTQNHSWGEPLVENHFYGSVAEAYDKSANENTELLHVFSVGNSGRAIGEEGTYAGLENFSNITGEYKMAKNLLVVSAVDWELNPLAQVSKGPAYDGRVKPELCAFNVNGSSGAAATVSGIASLLQQSYKNQHANALPASALLKAILINSADDAGPAGLDFQTGYGNVNAWRAHQALSNETYFSGTVTQSAKQEFKLTVPANAKNLKITLVWNDPAASPNANTALVNDLDLLVTQPNAETILPWVLNSSAQVDSLAKAAVRKADHINNIEQVTLDEPAAGEYTIDIAGFDIPLGNQTFYVVYEWEMANTFEWLYPTGSDNMPYLGEGTAASVDATYFRWDANYPAGTTGVLEYSIDNGVTWQLVDDAVDLSQRILYWEAPDAMELGLARMTINSTAYTTDEFTFSREFNVSVGFNCGDSTQFNWPYREGVDKYRLLQVQGNELVQLLETTDTFIVLNTETITDVRHVVEPVFANGTTAIRSPLFDYTQQGVGCYFTSFFPILAEDGKSIELNLRLGTFYGVKEISYERQVDGAFVTVATITDASVNPVVVNDIPTVSGLQYYRVRVALNHGEEITSDVVSIYFLGDDLPVLVFPNPVLQGESINIYTKSLVGKEAKFELFDQRGRQLMNREWTVDRGALFADGIEAGIYIYRVTIGDEVTVGRLAVQ